MSQLLVYQEFILNFPAPGGGGAHQALFRAGCLGARAGLTADQVVLDLKKYMPEGTREVPPQEVEDGVQAGYAEVTGKKADRKKVAPASAPAISAISKDALERIIKAGHGATEADIMARSPISLDFPARDTSWRVLEALYGLDAWIYIADDASPGILGKTINRCWEWIHMFKRTGASPWPKIMVNPLSGLPAPKKSGNGQTLRGDGSIAAHRFAVVEHDQMPLADQLAFWMGAPLPVAALIFSGKKSIHGWVRVDCADANEWRVQIEEKLFPGYLVPMGFDRTCKNASRLSRMPGHMRKDTRLLQKCLYLAPHGKAVAA
jgi:hypothetical protein